MAKPTKTKKPAAAKPKAEQGEFKILSGRPIPPRMRTGGESRYPFATMKAGDSFVIPVELDKSKKFQNDKERDKALAELKRRVSNRMAGATGRFIKKKDPKANFSVRSTAEGVEVWRNK